MTRLTRYTQQIFGSNAGANQIAEYGSLANSTPARYSGSTITPAIIQTLSQYLSGWNSAVVASNSPAIEDMNALCYLFAYQLSYILQAGIAEWDLGTTYYTGDLVQISGITYVSLQDTNLNNNPTSSTGDWGQPTQNGTITPNTLPMTQTVLSGTTLTWANLTIPSGLTLTINSNANFVGINPVTIASGGTLTINGTAKII
jgi:hypothetical protein